MAEDVRVVAFLHAKPGSEGEVRAAALACVAPTRAEAGCRAYDLTTDAQDPSLFVFVEHWDSRQALDEHMQTSHFKALAAAMKEALGLPMIVHVLNPA